MQNLVPKTLVYLYAIFRLSNRIGLDVTENGGINPAHIQLFKVSNGNTRKRCEICWKLIIKTPEQRYWRRSGVFIVNVEHISHYFPVFLLLNLNN